MIGAGSVTMPDEDRWGAMGLGSAIVAIAPGAATTSVARRVYLGGCDVGMVKRPVIFLGKVNRKAKRFPGSVAFKQLNVEGRMRPFEV